MPSIKLDSSTALTCFNLSMPRAAVSIFLQLYFKLSSTFLPQNLFLDVLSSPSSCAVFTMLSTLFHDVCTAHFSSTFRFLADPSRAPSQYFFHILHALRPRSSTPTSTLYQFSSSQVPKGQKRIK